MVFREYVATLMNIVWSLGYIHESARKSVDYNARIRVKGDKFLLFTIDSCIPTVKILADTFAELKPVFSEMQSWSKRLTKNYAVEYFQSKPSNLTRDDALDLSQDCLNWFQELYKVYNQPSTILINQQNLYQEIEKLSTKFLKPIQTILT